MVKLHWHDNLKDGDPFSYLSTLCFGIKDTPRDSISYRDRDANKKHIDTQYLNLANMLPNKTFSAQNHKTKGFTT